MKKQRVVFVVLLAFNTSVSALQNHDATTEPDSAAHSRISAGSNAALDRFQKRLAFLENYFLTTSSASFDTALSFKVSRNRGYSLGLSKEELSAITPGVDPIDNQIRRRSSSAPQTFNLGALVAQGVNAVRGKSGARKEHRRLQIIPSENEIRILKTLWEEKRASSAEIYRHLDSARVTASTLQEILAEMTDRGLLARAQISPRNEFTIATPFGAIPIEMSALNRKNREFVYQSTIDADEMWSYIDANIFSLSRPEGLSTDGLLVQHLRRLMQIMSTPSVER
jgi:hypothetical protein